jgi:hypothetical protein
VRHLKILAVVAGMLAMVACSESSTTTTIPVTPTTVIVGTDGTVTLTAPTPTSPIDDVQLTSLRPTLTVTNGMSSSTTGAKTYEFQVSDSSTFTSSNALSTFFTVVDSKTGVAEDSSGKTSYTLTSDLQPSTKFYWRARLTQGAVNSAWSSTATFKSKIAGYNRAGALYDPLTNGETVGTISGTATFVTNGLRIDTATTYVRYILPSVVSSGEFSMEVSGLQGNYPLVSGLANKPKIFGMQDGTGDYTSDVWRIDAQYRGVDGNPANCITFRAMFGSDANKIEPDITLRNNSVFLLDPSTIYFWKGTWNNNFRLLVQQGIGGTTLYDQTINVNAAYAPSTHVAYLGAPRGSYTEMSVIVGATYRNVWLGTTTRPTSLGSALE